MPATTLVLTDSAFLQHNGIIGGRQWFGNVTFSIPNSSSTWPGYGNVAGPKGPDYSTLNTVQAEAFRQIIRIWDVGFGYSLTETGDNTTPGDIRIAFTRTPDRGIGYAPPYDTSDVPQPWDGDIWLRASLATSNFSAVESPAAFEQMMVGVGKALGLRDGVNGDTRYAVMAANHYLDSTYVTVNSSLAGGQIVTRYVPPTTPMAYDAFNLLVLAPRPEWNAAMGDNTYTFSESSPFMMTIIDGGGVDTIDLSNHTRGSAVDLAPGSYSSVAYFSAADQAAALSAAFPSLAGQLAQRFAQSDVYTWSLNLSIGYKVEIENLYGGSGDDSFWGNNLNNVISGGAGMDFIRGGGGADRLFGGDAFDDLHGNLGDDTVNGGAGGDWVVGGQGNDNLFGDDGHDVVYGNLGNDYQEGGAGNDWVRGGQGDDVLLGGPGDDFIAGDRGDDNLTGGSGADTFHSFTGAGLDLITDFNAGEGDRVNLLEGTIYSVAQIGSDTVIDLNGTGRVVLIGVQLSSLPANWLVVG